MRAGSWAALAATGVLAACATPTTERPVASAASAADEAQKQLVYVLKARVAEQARVARVAARLMAANVDVCPAKAWRAGLGVAAIDGFDAKLRPAAQEALGMGDQPQVIFLDPGGAAAEAGLQTGDKLMTIGGRNIAPGPHATAQARGALTLVDKAGAAFPVEVLRGTERLTLTVTPRRACDYPVRVEDGDLVNAYADGKGLVVTRGMLRLTPTDEELAVVLGHELAHDTEGHIASQRRNAAAGMVGGAALDVLAAAAGVNTGGAFMKAAGQAGQQFASPEFEAEADYVGLYYAARAGYDIGHAEDFWRKMSVEAPGAIAVTTTHPANAQRYLALAATRREIEGKQSGQLALLPARRAPAKAIVPATQPSPTANALAAKGAS